MIRNRDAPLYTIKNPLPRAGSGEPVIYEWTRGHAAKLVREGDPWKEKGAIDWSYHLAKRYVDAGRVELAEYCLEVGLAVQKEERERKKRKKEWNKQHRSQMGFWDWLGSWF